MPIVFKKLSVSKLIIIYLLDLSLYLILTFITHLKYVISMPINK